VNRFLTNPVLRISNKKDKSHRNLEATEFQRSSNKFFIYPEYKNDTMNFDICLIKTQTDEYGIPFDLSSKFDLIPCLPDRINLEEVKFVFSHWGSIKCSTKIMNFENFANFHDICPFKASESLAIYSIE